MSWCSDCVPENIGFPTEITDDPLLDLVLAAPEAHPNAEERRLLYVAITRARRHTFLLAEGGPPSSFATELTEGCYDITVFGRPTERDVSCPICVEGRLIRRENRQNGSVFYGCSNYPYCEYSQRPCPVCREGLLIKDGENSSAATAASPPRPALNATTGWRSGWASTAASWDARVFQLAAIPGRFGSKGHREKAPHTATTPPETDCRSRFRPPSRPVLRSSCGRTAPRPGRRRMLQTP